MLTAHRNADKIKIYYFSNGQTASLRCLLYRSPQGSGRREPDRKSVKRTVPLCSEGYKGIGGISEISDASTFISNSSDKTFLIGIYAVDLNYNGGSH